MIVGGASATAVTAHHQSVADGVRADAETWWYGEKFAEYVVVAVVEQTVAGTNYTFKIRRPGVGVSEHMGVAANAWGCVTQCVLSRIEF